MIGHVPRARSALPGEPRLFEELDERRISKQPIPFPAGHFLGAPPVIGKVQAFAGYPTNAWELASSNGVSGPIPSPSTYRVAFELHADLVHDSADIKDMTARRRSSMVE